MSHLPLEPDPSPSALILFGATCFWVAGVLWWLFTPILKGWSRCASPKDTAPAATIGQGTIRQKMRESRKRFYRGKMWRVFSRRNGPKQHGTSRPWRSKPSASESR